VERLGWGRTGARSDLPKEGKRRGERCRWNGTTGGSADAKKSKEGSRNGEGFDRNKTEKAPYESLVDIILADGPVTSPGEITAERFLEEVGEKGTPRGEKRHKSPGVGRASGRRQT